MEANDDAGSVQPDAGSIDVDKSKDTVNFETYQKSVTQEKNLRERLKLGTEEVETLKKRLESFESKEQEAEETRMKDKEQWKDLYQKKEEELNTAKAGEKEWKDSFWNSVKLSAVQNALPSKVKNDKYLNFIDVDKIIVDEETGSLNVDSIKAVAEDFLKEHGSLLKGAKGVSLPGDAAMPNESLSMDTWKKLPLKERKQRMGEVFKTTYTS